MKDQTNHSNWADFNKNFSGKFPFQNGNPLESLDLSSIHNYVQNALSQVSGENIVLASEVFETHHWVIAKVRIPEKLHSKNLKVWVNSNHIKLEGLAERKEQIINLPCRAVASSYKAIYKKGILEIRMPKFKYTDRYHEVFY